MDVRLSPEQQALRESAAQMVDRLGPRAVRDIDDAERVAKLDAAVGAAGWRELRAAGDGTLPLASGVEAAIVAEELGRGLADVSFLGPTLAVDLRRRAGVAPSATVETVALRPDLSAPAGRADATAVAIDGRNATSALVIFPIVGGYALAVTPVGVSAGGPDLTRPAVAVDPAGAEPVAGASAILTEADLRAWTAFGLSVLCADLVGVMRGALNMTREYAGTRKQFGAAVGSFQAVQHLLADAFVALEGSRGVALHAAWAADSAPPDDALAAASVAKAYCARAARSVCETAIQVHGGIGNTWECLAHVFLRRALVSCDVLGGVGTSLARVLEHNGIGGGSGLR